MLNEFRDFLLRGNIVELAVAFVMGVAFGALITSFVDNRLMPIVAMIIGKPDFRELTFTINRGPSVTAPSQLTCSRSSLLPSPCSSSS